MAKGDKIESFVLNNDGLDSAPIVESEALVLDVESRPVSKLPTQRIDSDDCVVHVGRVVNQDGSGFADNGEPIAVHEGEYIEIVPVGSFRESFAFAEITRAATIQQEISADTDIDPQKRLQKLTESIGLIEAAYGELRTMMSDRIVGWNWTDNFGDRIPSPFRNPDVLSTLTTDEFHYLVGILNGNGEQQRKNGSKVSPTSSSRNGTRKEKG